MLHVECDEIAIRRLENVADGWRHELVDPKADLDVPRSPVEIALSDVSWNSPSIYNCAVLQHPMYCPERTEVLERAALKHH